MKKLILSKKMMILTGCLVVFIGLLFLSFVFEHNGSREIVHNKQTETGLYWQNRIQEVGGDVAYKEFTLSIDNLTTGRHTQAHVFGGALYAVEGFKGLDVCDARFLYGCLHEVIGRAILEGGIGSIKDLDDTCKGLLGNKVSFCQHGIGHGIQAYFGYTLKDLSQALKLCDTVSVTDTNRIGGCYGGIFMEYNLQSMLADDGEVRVSDNYLKPCIQLDEEYLPACIFWQSQWWRNGPLSSFGSDEEVFKEMGKYCYEITDERRLIDICFQGVGNIIAPGVDFDTALSVRMCEAATVSGHDSALCRAAAAKRTVDGVDAKTALEICTGLPESYYKDCFSQLEERENNKESHE